MTGGLKHHEQVSSESRNMCSRRTRAEELACAHIEVLIDVPSVMIEPATGSDTLGREWHRGARGVGK